MQFHVDKMGCGGCARSITNAIHAADATAQVDIDLATKRVNVTSELGQGAIERVLSDAGFPPQLIT